MSHDCFTWSAPMWAPCRGELRTNDDRPQGPGDASPRAGGPARCRRCVTSRAWPTVSCARRGAGPDMTGTRRALLLIPGSRTLRAAMNYSAVRLPSSSRRRMAAGCASAHSAAQPLEVRFGKQAPGTGAAGRAPARPGRWARPRRSRPRSRSGPVTPDCRALMPGSTVASRWSP